ncbi:protein-glutamate methylesterase/protein-glutamine glutaminase [Hydrogenimonas thermophila]|uniref:Protein-glutamate methylesterase/protein-glutamine glutaminase n=1 Tax=Hydrogenimonas thermophila TaxID=223786 RepID=A0A1I5PGH3_9BACT|nr:chemotaxis response regulator protein-glutamate methylesterase [Hydrogenimonas thermophila]WOE70742.1 chemotaxis response regulator protein-glutamate methylesterase [Hydrogenimonas thermophila]WOE73259.1 chemotaxis response regulator protein-glutamate methylesterase [Hydrogenimonas thermophila]SFP32910.1 two-component system, chemotaxis family, response regulator CheB [Hydrogenimonas thermophila]
MPPIKLFIVDDSAVMRQTLIKLVENETDIEVLGVASDPIFAMNKFKLVGYPDVMILDIEMPRMDGITFLKKIMKEHPIPVIMCSSLVEDGNYKAIEALQAGAVEIIAKPKLGIKSFLENTKESLISTIITASKAKLNRRNSTSDNSIIKTKTSLQKINNITKSTKDFKSIIAIGSSTGGVQVLEKIVKALPSKCAPIVITQHMPPKFTASLAKRLNSISNVEVKEAENGEKVEHSHIYIAPGDKHLLIKRDIKGYLIILKDGPRVCRHRPSVDVMFRSIANEVGENAIGIILTGMGDDGAHGLKEMFDNGAKTYAEDEKSCVVYGMPKEAVKLGGVTKSLDIDAIIEVIKNAR